MTEQYTTTKTLEEIISFVILMTGEFPKHDVSYILEKWENSQKYRLDLTNQETLERFFRLWVY